MNTALKRSIVSLTTLAVGSSLIAVPPALARSPFMGGQAYVDIVGRDIDPDTGEIGWSAFARVPKNVSMHEDIENQYENEMSFVLPAECIEKPEIVNALQLETERDSFGSSERNDGSQTFNDLNDDQRKQIIEKIKSDPDYATIINLYVGGFGQSAESVNTGDQSKPIDPNFHFYFDRDIKKNISFNQESLNENLKFLRENFPEYAKKMEDGGGSIVDPINYDHLNDMIESSPQEPWQNHFRDLVYARVIDKYQFVDKDGKTKYVTTYNRVPANWDIETQTNISAPNSRYSIPQNVFVNVADTTVYRTISDKPWDMVFGGASSNAYDYDSADQKYTNDLETGEFVDPVFLAKLQEPGEPVNLTDDKVKEVSDFLASVASDKREELSQVFNYPIEEVLKSATATNRDTPIVPLKESTIPVNSGPLEPQEFVKVTDKNSGKQFWQRTFYTQASSMSFDVKAKADLDCLTSRGLMKPGTTFYIPAQWFWKKRLAADETENGKGEEGAPTHYTDQGLGSNFVDAAHVDDYEHEYPNGEGGIRRVPSFGLGINTLNNPNAEPSKFGGAYYDMRRKNYEDWVVRPPVNGDNDEFITRGILKADRTNSYDMRQGIYDNPFCMVSRNERYKDDLNTGITRLKDLSAIDYDEKFPGEKKNGISVENPMLASEYMGKFLQRGDTLNFNAFSVEDMCDQAGAKITIPENFVTTTVSTTTTQAVTTTPPNVTQTLTTTPEPVTSIVTTTPPNKTVVVTTPVQVTKTVTVTPPEKTIIKTTENHGTPVTLTTTLTPEPHVSTVTEPGRPSTITSVITPNPVTSTRIVTPTPITTTQVITPSVVTVTSSHNPPAETLTETPKTEVVTETGTPVTVTETPATTTTVVPKEEFGSVTRERVFGFFGVIAALASIVGIINVIINLIAVPAVVDKSEPTPEPTPEKPADNDIIIKNGIACPAYKEVKGLCKPIDQP